MKLKIPDSFFAEFISFVELGLGCLEQNNCQDYTENEKELVEFLKKLVDKYGE